MRRVLSLLTGITMSAGLVAPALAGGLHGGGTFRNAYGEDGSFHISVDEDFPGAARGQIGLLHGSGLREQFDVMTGAVQGALQGIGGEIYRGKYVNGVSFSSSVTSGGAGVAVIRINGIDYQVVTGKVTLDD